MQREEELSERLLQSAPDNEGEHSNSAPVTTGEPSSEALDYQTERAEQSVNKLDPTYRLAFAKTTPLWFRWLCPVIILITHLNYAYGQYADMWYLFFGVDFNGSFEAKSIEAKLLFDVLKVDNPLTLNISIVEPLDNFTYGTTAKKLWLAKDLDNKTLPRVAAIILILFSGIWPHLKLFILNYYWHSPIKQTSRTSALYWLSTLGKFSIADVFVVCALVAVCSLDIDLDPNMILYRLEGELPEIIRIAKSSVSENEAVNDICNELLHLRCQFPHYEEDSFSWDIAHDIQTIRTNFEMAESASIPCNLCHDIVVYEYENPDSLSPLINRLVNGISAKGSGLATLRIAGLRGIHIFCIAVISSLMLGLVMEILDHFARREGAKERMKHNRRHGRIYDNETEQTLSIEAAEAKPVLLFTRSAENVLQFRSYVILCVVATTACVFTVWGSFAPTMIREVPGSLPEIINETLSYDFGQKYSMWTLTKVVGDKGGWDIFLMCLFGFFCLIGPIIRSAFCIIQLLVPLTKKQHKINLHVIDFLGVFCALDVMFIALYLVDIEMPPITNTIINPRAHFCKILHSFGFSESCLEIEFHTIPEFSYVVLGWFALSITAMFLNKLQFHALDPYEDGDRGGPYCGEKCPNCLWDSHRDRYGNDL